MKKLVGITTGFMFLLSAGTLAFAQSTQSGGMGNTETGSEQKITPPQSQSQGATGGPQMGTGGASGSNTVGGTSAPSGTNTGGGTSSSGTRPAR
jgi:hypothetical protein